MAQALARLAAAPGVHHIAVMPDVHLADHVCVGTVVGTHEVVYPQAVGGDIGCGMAAVALDGDPQRLDAATAERLLACLHEVVPALRQRAPRPDTLGELSDPRLQQRLRRDAAIEFGTLGRGNHFLELQADEAGGLWLMVHTGSRAVGPALQEWHLARGEPVGGGLRALAVDGPGRDYVHDVGVAVAWAAANRRAVAEAAAPVFADVLGATITWSSWFDCAHNFVRRERHGDDELWVHRKGAVPAARDEPGIIPGSMGSRSFHVLGRGLAEALGSSSHGAGRRLPRGEAARTIRLRDLEQDMRGVFFDTGKAMALRDEAPRAYKDVGAVMRAQRELTRIVRTLRPLLAFKGT